MTQALYSNAGFEQMLEIRKGATLNFEVSIVDTEEVPIDITGWEFRATIASKAEPATDKQDFEFGTPGVDGRVMCTLTAAKTDTLLATDSRLAVARYRWNCDAKTPDDEIIPVCFGDVLVKNTDVDWS